MLRVNPTVCDQYQLSMCQYTLCLLMPMQFSSFCITDSRLGFVGQVPLEGIIILNTPLSPLPPCLLYFSLPSFSPSPLLPHFPTLITPLSPIFPLSHLPSSTHYTDSEPKNVYPEELLRPDLF